MGIKMYKRETLQVMTAPGSILYNGMALLWNKHKAATSYWIYINQKKAIVIQDTDHTLRNLLADTLYEVYVEAISGDGTLLAVSNRLLVQTPKKPEIFDITQYGAIGDGKTINTEAIQSAIDNCSEGGYVYIPKGVYSSGAIYLKSDMKLYIEAGGKLLGSNKIEDFPIMTYRFEGLETKCYASLINVKEAGEKRLKNITISGLGTIDANGSRLRRKELREAAGKPGRAICIRNTDYLYMEGVTVRQSPAWCVHFIYCNKVSINNLKVYTKWDENGIPYEGISNGDGIDPDSSCDVYIFRTEISSQDDCIAIKSGKDEEGRRVGVSSENYRITNCIFKSGFGIAVGSEMSGSVRNVFVQDCIFENTYSIGSVKAPRGRGGSIENITYEDISFANLSLEHEDCKWFRGAIYIDQFYSHGKFDVNKREKLGPETPVIKDITFRNIVLKTLAGNAIYMTGLPESPLEHITLSNIKAKGRYGMIANNIRNLMLDEVEVQAKEGKGFLFHNIKIEGNL